jgi:recombination protein RecA
MVRELTALEQSLLKNINNKFGEENPMVQLGENEDFGKVKDWIDTGNLALNWLISGQLSGGYPVGRISELDGDPSTGKSLLCQLAMKDPTIDLIVVLDTEAAFNIEFIKFLGVDPDKILYMPIDTVEQITSAAQEVLDTIKMNKSNKKVLFIIDSIALATTEKEADPDSGKDMGNKAQLLRTFFRVYARKIERYNIGLLVTNHYTQKIGVTYGSNKTTTGGTALPYAASVRIDLKIGEMDIDKKSESIGAHSVTIKATTKKNRCFSPHRKISFLLDFERGVNKYSGLFGILKDMGIGEKNGPWCKIPSWNPDEKFFEKDFPELCEKHNLLPFIQEKMDEFRQKELEEDPEISEEAIAEDEKKKDKKKKVAKVAQESLENGE